MYRIHIFIYISKFDKNVLDENKLTGVNQYENNSRNHNVQMNVMDFILHGRINLETINIINKTIGEL